MGGKLYLQNDDGRGPATGAAPTLRGGWLRGIGIFQIGGFFGCIRVGKLLELRVFACRLDHEVIGQATNGIALQLVDADRISQVSVLLELSSHNLSDIVAFLRLAGNVLHQTQAVAVQLWGRSRNRLRSGTGSREAHDLGALFRIRVTIVAMMQTIRKAS